MNLTKLAESLLPLLHENMDDALKLAEVSISGYAKEFNSAWISGMRSKLGLFNEEEDDYVLAQNLFKWMENAKADFTSTFRDLSYERLSENEIYKSPDFKKWYELWQQRLLRNSKTTKSALILMRKHNPVIVPYNHFVEEALLAAENGNMKPFNSLLAALLNPFALSASNESFQQSTIQPNPNYQTFCGT